MPVHERQAVRTYRDLVVWQKAMQLVTNVYEMTADFPRTETFGLVSQLRRCAVSIPSTIAEGYGRRSSRDYLRCLQIAVGSLYELQTQTQIARNLSFASDAVCEAVESLSCEVERMLCALANRIREKVSHSVP